MGENILILTLMAFIAICTSVYMVIIPLFKKKHIEQIVRLDGPKSHYKKNHTPVMGGVIIVCSTILCFFLLLVKNPLFARVDLKDILILLVPFLGYALIGLVDDIRIVKFHKNDGLSPTVKFLFQLMLAIFTFAIFLGRGFSTKINIFGLTINLSFLYGFFLMFIYLAMTNAVNFTDGIDGLSGGVSVIALLCFSKLAYNKEMYLLVYFGLSLASMLLVFLLFNLPKAKIFMGDCGSLAIGAAISSIAILLKMEVLLVIIGFVFVLEALSVVIQITYFKKTKGKRIFKMAPLHHHLELENFTEWQIDLIFWSLSIVMGLLGFVLGVKLF